MQRYQTPQIQSINEEYILAVTSEREAILFDRELNVINKLSVEIDIDSMIYSSNNKLILSGTRYEKYDKIKHNLAGVVIEANITTGATNSVLFEKPACHSMYMFPNRDASRFAVRMETAEGSNSISLHQPSKQADPIFIQNTGGNLASMVWGLQDQRLVTISHPIQIGVNLPNAFVAIKDANIWDTETGELASVFRQHSSTLSDIDVDPTGIRVVSASTDTTVLIWNIETGETERTLEGFSNPITQIYGHYRDDIEWVQYVRWSPCGNYIAGQTWNQELLIWNATSGKRIVTPRCEIVRFFEWSPNSDFVAFSDGESLHILDLIACTIIDIPIQKVEELWLERLLWHTDNDGTYLLAVGQFDDIHIWSQVDGKSRWYEWVYHPPQSD